MPLPVNEDVAVFWTRIFPSTVNVDDAVVVVPTATLPFPPTKNAGVDVPSSEITNEGEVEPISTERVPQGVVVAMPMAERPIPPEPSEEEKTVSNALPSIFAV